MAGAPDQADRESSFWLAASSKPIFFFLALLTAAGIYTAFQMPISVFPETNFPRVVIGVDNGVMPVEQMQVTITKPIEDAVNSVPGLATVRSDDEPRAGRSQPVLRLERGHVPHPAAGGCRAGEVQQALPATARITTNRLTFATFPILGYSLTADPIPFRRSIYGKSLRTN